MVNLMHDLYTNNVVVFVFSSYCQGTVCCEGYHAWLTVMYDLYTNSVVGFVFSSNCQGLCAVRVTMHG